MQSQQNKTKKNVAVLLYPVLLYRRYCSKGQRRFCVVLPVTSRAKCGVAAYCSLLTTGECGLKHCAASTHNRIGTFGMILKIGFKTDLIRDVSQRVRNTPGDKTP